jgi:transcriptional regulator GlxA family with amidase domain
MTLGPSPGFRQCAWRLVSAFVLANVTAAKALYGRSSWCSEKGGAIPVRWGVRIEKRNSRKSEIDTLIVTGLLASRAREPGLIEQVRKASESSRRVASVCTELSS